VRRATMSPDRTSTLRTPHGHLVRPRGYTSAPSAASLRQVEDDAADACGSVRRDIRQQRTHDAEVPAAMAGRPPPAPTAMAAHPVTAGLPPAIGVQSGGFGPADGLRVPVLSQPGQRIRSVTHVRASEVLRVSTFGGLRRRRPRRPRDQSARVRTRQNGTSAHNAACAGCPATYPFAPAIEPSMASASGSLQRRGHPSSIGSFNPCTYWLTL